jgi:probable HAF family extracellular repeat protein
MRTQGEPRRGARRILGVLLALAGPQFAQPALAATYNVVDLATLAQGTSTVVRGPNLAGTAVGGGRINGAAGSSRHGLVFDRGTVVNVPGLPGTDYSNVLGTNDGGRLVGAANAATAMRAFATTTAGDNRELAPLPGDTASAAFAVNNVGTAVGYSSGPDGERAVTWTPAGVAAALAGTAGATNRAYSINERGDVVGVIGSSVERRATLWPASGAARTLPGLAGFAASEAAWINASGDVVGYSSTADEVRRATLWPAGGAPSDLGVLPGGAHSQAFGTNDAGAVVGSSDSADGTRAVLWTRTGGVQDLNLTKAVGINNRGVIIALGHEPSGDAHDHELPIRVVMLVPAGG